jgi:hypothetical protein
MRLMRTMSTTSTTARRVTLATTLLALALAAACGKKTDKAKPGADPTTTATTAGDAGGGAGAGTGTGTGSATGAAAAIDATGAGSVAPAPGATGALARFGEPSLSHADVIDRIVVGKDGALLTCSRGAVRLWDAGGGLRWGHNASLRPGACGLSADGAHVVVLEQKDGAGGSYAPRVYDVASGASRALAGPSAASWLGFDGDAVLGVQREQVQRWVDGKPTTIATLAAPPRDVALSPDGKTIAWTDGSKLYVHALDEAATATPLPVTLDGDVKHLALSADGARVAVAGDRKVTLVDVASGAVTWSSKLTLATPYAPAVAFRPDGGVVAGRVNRVVTLAPDGAFPPVTPVARFVGWTASGSASVLEGKDSYELALDTGARTPAAEDRSPDWADEQSVAADGTVTAWTAEGCSALRVWRSGGGERTLPAPAGCDDAHDGVQGWRVSGDRAIALGTDVTIYDLADGKVLATLADDERAIEDVAVSADGATVVALLDPPPPTDDPQLADQPDRDKLMIATWSIAAGKPATQKARAVSPAQDAEAVALAPDGSRAYLGLRSGHVVTVDATSFAESARRGPQASAIIGLDVDPRSGRVAATDVELSTSIYPP